MALLVVALAFVPAQAAPKPLLIVVSIDAFRPDYMGTGLTPNLDRLAASGVRGTMRPSFPTLTFPNHYALATGLRPDRNGMVENKMVDPANPDHLFESKDAKLKVDPFWWDEAEPIWVGAQKAGIRAGVMMWPGSDIAIRGTRAGDWWPYQDEVTTTQRIDGVLDWARRPAASRPGIVLAYLSVVDKAGHADGIHSAAMRAAIADVDQGIGRLVAGLRAIGRPVNLIVLSDHGMEDAAPDHVLPLKPLLDRTIMHPVTAGGTVVSVWPLPGKDKDVAAALLRPIPHLDCHRREDLPVRLHYGHNPRVPPFYCLVEPGWRYSEDPPKDHASADHGYDNDDPAMTALFLGAGPAFRRGATVAKFDNVDVYPLMRGLIGLPAVSGLDGTDAVFQDVVRP